MVAAYFLQMAFPVLLCATLLTLLITPLVKRLGMRLGWVDIPRSPKQIHTRPIVRMGGVAIYLGFVIALVFARWVWSNGASGSEVDYAEARRVTGLLLGVTIAAGMGLLDDVRPLGWIGQMIGQVSAAAVAIFSGIVTVDLNIPFLDPYKAVAFPSMGLAVLFTLFWFVGMMNTINWIDGLDGLAAGVSLIAGIILLLRTINLTPPQYSIALLMVALVGTLVGFLPYNSHPARIFMGSTGAYTIGFLLAALAIIGGAKVGTALLVLWLPIVEAAWVIFRRASRRRNPMRGGDVEHLHRRLMLLGLSQRTVVFLYYGITLLLGLLVTLLSGIQVLYALVGIGVVFGVAMALLVHATRHTGLPRPHSDEEQYKMRS